MAQTASFKNCMKIPVGGQHHDPNISLTGCLTQSNSTYSVVWQNKTFVDNMQKLW